MLRIQLKAFLITSLADRYDPCLCIQTSGLLSSQDLFLQLKCTLLIKPGFLEPRTINVSNFHTIVAKCIQTGNWNKNQTTQSYFYFDLVCVTLNALGDIWNLALYCLICSKTNCMKTFSNHLIEIAAIYCSRS